MNEHGRRLLRWWKQHSPTAYDELADPAAHFAELGAVVEREIEEQVRRHLVGDGAFSPRDDLVLMPASEVALAELPAHLVRDPRGDFVDADGMPRYSHRLWRLLDDPTVPAAVFRTEWLQWLQGVPTYERSVVEAPDEGSWSVVSDGAPRERPVLLLDIDGCLSPLRPVGSDTPGSGADVSVDPTIAAGIIALADRYGLAWATTWEDLAHLLGTELGWPRLPIISVLSARSRDPDGWDSRKIAPILEFVGERPFAWVDDLVSRTDAARLTRQQTCLIIRPDPAVGLVPDHLRVLNEWAERWVVNQAGQSVVPRQERPSVTTVGRALLTPEMAEVVGFPGQDNAVRREVLKETLDAFNATGARYAELAAQNLTTWREQAPVRRAGPSVQVLPGDWGEVAATLTRRHGQCFAVLNMANAYVPGGAYVEGGAAQEENMFRRSDCHFSITSATFDPDLDRYHDHMTRLLEARDGRVYLDTEQPRVCIRGPEVRSQSDLGYRWLPETEVFPFYELRAAARDMRDGSAFDEPDMRTRIRAQLTTLIDHGVRHAVLGAFGCGAFRNPGEEVAAIYRDEVRAHLDAFDVIAFAVFNAGYGPQNFAKFKRVLGPAE